MTIPYIIRFWLYLIFLIPSVLCALFCLYHFLIDRVLRKALNNHVVMLILFLGVFLNLTDIVWYIDFYRTGRPLSLTEAFCMTWTYIDYAVFVSITLLVAWGSIERHILIFHQNLVSTQIKRFLVHYLPLFTVTMYPFIYYIIIYFVLPCDPWIDFTTSGCGISACAYNTAFLGMWDSIAHNIVPIFTIVIFSMTLFGRIWYSKYRINQRMRWKNYRKMSIQLLSISAIYLIIVFPSMILYTLYTAGIRDNSYYDFFDISYYLSYFVTLLAPFVSVVSLSELRTKLKKIIQLCSLSRCTRRNQIIPI
ncbi:unnamed protein product [Adineta steineri]|uniref:G-protein coupled receptors family 1 profile domain-containing protein n=1 Tax=Adineta steineri TaxID=433720 RepID=A0A815KG55_9BILA|nr:unnamed protein product [Adineta steineri]CAF3991123.1 unnamed protein product [Adineta steineri]